MRFLRILPLVWARMTCSLSSFTRNMAFGRSSVTMPLNSIISSLDKQTSLNGTKIRRRSVRWAEIRPRSSFRQTDGNGSGVGGKALGIGKRNGGGADLLQSVV